MKTENHAGHGVSRRSRRSPISRGGLERSRNRVSRAKNSSSAHKWAKQSEILLKFKKAAADMGGAPIEHIAWVLGSDSSAKDLKIVSAAAACSGPEAAFQYLTIMTLMKNVYQDIHTCCAPGLINSTSDLAYFFGRESTDSTRNQNWLQFNLALRTQAMLSVIEYALAGSESIREYLSNTVNTAVHQLRDQPDTIGRTSDVVATEIHLSTRYASFAADHGWMMLSIMANSAAFREAARTLNDSSWIAFNVSVCQNKDSLEYFAKIRGLNWTFALTRKPEFASYITDLREGYPAIQPDHPHNFIVPQNSEPISRPEFKGKIQKNVTNNRLRPTYRRSKKIAADPTVQRGRNCYICESVSCDCEPSSILRPLVELVRSRNGYGVGIRVLQPIRKNQVLAEYVGDLHVGKDIPGDWDTDYTYTLAYDLDKRPRSIASINAAEHGNWTRYINHSCDADACFITIPIGKRFRVMVMAVKDVDMFEELTVDYGDSYWATRPILCKCGSPKCRFATVEKRDNAAIAHGLPPIGY